MNHDELKAALEAMAKEKEERYSELRKPTRTEVRQSRVQFEISPHWGIASFTLGCVYCNTGRELDYFGKNTPNAMIAFFGNHRDCTPGCEPPETRNRKASKDDTHV